MESGLPWDISLRCGRDGIKMPRQQIYDMPFGMVYDCLVAKAERKGHTRDEVDELTRWLTGYDDDDIAAAYLDNYTYGDFFRKMPQLNPNAKLIKGSICGVKIEEIEDPLMKHIRYLDKLVDELARGKAVEKIKRG